MKYLLTLCIGILMLGSAFAQQIVGAEYFIDQDPGVGQGTYVSATASGDDIAIDLQISTNGLSPGFHKLYVRTKDDVGAYSIGEGRSFYVLKLSSSTASSDLDGFEYYIDSDPGVGNGVFVDYTDGSSLDGSLAIPLANISEGFHQIGIRTKSASGDWSIGINRKFYVLSASQGTTSPSLVGFEYFIDSDPGVGNGTLISLTTAENYDETLMIPIGNLSRGYHTIGLRSKDAIGNWGVNVWRKFYVLSASSITPSANIQTIEYFFDQDPGIGNGTVITNSLDGDDITEDIMIDVTGKAIGMHTVYVRVIDKDGKASIYQEAEFEVRAVGTDATLSEITLDVGSLDPVFDAATLSYDVVLPYSTSELNLGATLADANASLTGTGAIAITHGVAKTVDIEVTAEDGTTQQTYQVTFTTEPNTDASLSGITLDVGSLDPEFDPNTFDYSAHLSVGTQSVTVGATLSDANAMISGDGAIDVSSGSGTATLIVTAEDNTTKATYTINFTVEKITWNGTAWNNNDVGPSATEDAVISGDFTGAFSCANLTINSAATLTVNGTLDINGNLDNQGDLIVASGATLLTYDGYSIAENIIVKRTTRYADGKYSFVGTPVQQDQTITGADLGSWVYTYNESTPYGADGLDRWEDAKADVLMPGKGYAQAGEQEIMFAGKPNVGTITYTGAYTDNGDAHHGWNLVANPYTAAISFTEFMNDNTNNTGSVYIWDDNGSDTGRGTDADYIVINASGNTNSNAGNLSRYNGHIGSSQAFFVKLDGQGNNNVVFEEDQRVSGNNEDEHFFRSTETISRARLNLTSANGLFKQTLLAWNEGVNDLEINRLYDAAIFNQDAADALYTYKLGQPLAIQTITSNRNEVPLGLNIQETGNYTLALDNSEYSGALFLQDIQTGNIHDLAEGSYQFYTQKGKVTERFKVLTGSSTLLGTDQLNSWKVFAGNKMIHIQLASGRDTQEFKVLSLSGQELKQVLVEGHLQIDAHEIPSGIYIVTDGQNSKKIFIP